MPLIDTSTLTPDARRNYQLTNFETMQVYCGLDSALTWEIWGTLREQYGSQSQGIYNFEKALMGPYLEIMQRGFRVDEISRRREAAELREQDCQLREILEEYARAVWDRPLNPRSPKQLQEFFYGAMRLPEIWISQKGERKLSMNREVLEKLDQYLYARPFCQLILAIRDLAKQMEILEKEIDPDGRFRSSYNISGTETGRPSSSENAFGTGCVRPTAQALTPSGWTPLSQINDGDFIAQWDNYKISFVPCIMHRGEFNGKMLQARGEQFDLTVTPNHRVVFNSYRSSTFKTISADEVRNISAIKIPLGGRFIPDEGNAEYPVFLPMLMADFSKDEWCWRGQLKKERKIKRFLNLMAAYQIEFRETKAKPGYRRFTIPGYTDLPKKWGKWVLNVAPRQAQRLLEEARYWDAHDRGSGFQFYTADREQAEWFATFAHIAGKAATIQFDKPQSKGSYSSTPMNIVNVKDRNFARVAKTHWSEIEYNGEVCCPQVESGYWLVRENGKISVTGNSNAQNIAPAMRHIFVADEGKKICVIDLEQVEARDVGFIVGNLFDDWKFLDNCECLTADHEVLTPQGWVSISNKPGTIATWNTSEEIIFDSVSKWNEGESTEFVEINNNMVSVKGTRGHTMPVFGHNGGSVRKESLAYIASHRTFSAPNSGKLLSEGREIKEAALIAAFQADGHRNAQGQITWTFAKKRKIDRMEEILNRLGYKYSRYELGAGTTRFYLHTGQKQETWAKFCGKEILEWDRKSLVMFCASHKFWDGSYEGSRNRITAKSKSHLDWLATAYFLVGDTTTLHPHKIDYWSLGVNARTTHQYRAANIKEIITEPTAVYCPTVVSGYFLVKRNDKIFISGNSGDLHTNNCKLVWPTKPWTQDKKKNREIADEIFYRDFSFRDMAKRGGHLSNYYGTAFTMARSLKIPLAVAEEFQARYVRGGMVGGTWIEPAFPGIARWWEWTSRQLQTKHFIETPFGRRRHFFGRPNDDTTLREAIAFLPQSTTADRMNLGLWRVWHKMPQVELLAQTYDSITFQYDDRGHKYESQIISEALEHIKVELVANNGRRYVVPGEAKIGWNWGYEATQTQIDKAIADGKKPPRLNIEGLKKWNLQTPDTRQRRIGLDRLG